jgi:AcrR family transcriptional regulator
MGRHYDMSRRGAAAAETRAAIIAAAHRLLDREEATGLTLQEVAAEAGVSRATLYKSVGSRRALLAAVFEDQGRRIAFDRVQEAMRRADPARAIIATVRECGRAWAASPEAIRRTLALAALDPEIGALVRKYEGYRQSEVETLVRRAHRAGALAPALDVPAASVTLALLTAFTTFDALRARLGVRPATGHLVRIARTTLGLTGVRRST